MDDMAHPDAPMKGMDVGNVRRVARNSIAQRYGGREELAHGANVSPNQNRVCAGARRSRNGSRKTTDRCTPYFPSLVTQAECMASSTGALTAPGEHREMSINSIDEVVEITISCDF